MNISANSAYAAALNALQQADAQMSGAAQRIARGDVSPASLVDLKQSEVSFQANVKVLETAKANTDRLLDVFA